MKIVLTLWISLKGFREPLGSPQKQHNYYVEELDFDPRPNLVQQVFYCFVFYVLTIN